MQLCNVYKQTIVNKYNCYDMLFFFLKEFYLGLEHWVSYKEHLLFVLAEGPSSISSTHIK